MRIACPSCGTSYNVDERRIPAAGLNVRCPRCQSAFPVRPPEVLSGQPTPVPLPKPGEAPWEEGLGGDTIRFDSPFASPPPTDAPPPGEAWVPRGATESFPMPDLPTPGPGEPGGPTMRFEAPFRTEAPAPAAPGSVPLPSPSAPPFPPLPVEASPAPPLTPPPVEEEAPVPPAAPLGFGEVELPGGPADAPFADDPLPVAPDPPFDPFASGPAAPPDPLAAAPDAAGSPGGPLAPPPDPFASPPAPPPAIPSASEGPGALGRKETEELEALFEGAPTPAPPARPSRPRIPAGPEWKIRRRSGKVFGPFPEGEVVQMLTRGELLGNEEVSSDGGSSWSAIGEAAAFAEAIRRLIERPSSEESAQSVAFGEPARVAPAPRPRGPGPLERLAMIRERLVSVLDQLPSWIRYAVPAGLAALVLGAGLAAGLTDYGFFLHRLIRGQVGPGRPGARLCTQARAHFAEDTFPGAQEALGLVVRAVALSPVDREAKGIGAQVAFWMARRTGATPASLEVARAWMAELRDKSPDRPDTLKAQLSMAIWQGGSGGAEAAAALERELARSPNDEEALYLLGEWMLARGDEGRAEGYLKRLAQRRPSARAEHALGLAAAARGDPAAATGHLEEALRRDPKHLASALELAELSLRSGALAAAGERLSALLLPEAMPLLGPREKARCRHLRGEILARQLGAKPEARLAEAEKELAAAVGEDPGYLPARLALARFLLRRNAPDRALAALEPVAASATPEVADLRARALAGSGRVLDAMTALDLATARSGPGPRLTFARGLVLEAGGKRVEAEKLYAEAAADPGYWEPHLALGRSRLRAGDVEKATPEILLAVERAPAEADAQAGLGELRLAKRDLAGAEEAWKKALSLDPAHAPSHLGLARVALARKDSAAAAQALELATRFDPRLGEAQVTLGDLRWKAGDLPGAAAQYKAASGLDPRQAVARTRLGAVELEMGQAEAAYVDLLGASNVEVALAENRFWLGRALLAKGDAAQAVEQLSKAVDIDRENARHHLWLGIALERASKLGEAADALREALRVDPRLGEAAERLGLVYATLSRCGEAVPFFEKAVQLAPAEQRLRMELADCQIKLGQSARAIQTYKDALRADPKMVALYYRIARAVHESVGANEAVPWYERAAQLEKANPMPHYYLGFAYKVRGRRARAVEEFRAYLRLKPDADDRKDIEREIEDLGG